MKNALMVFVASLGLAGPASAINVNWAEWQSQPDGQSATGQIDDGGTLIDINFSTTGSLSPAAILGPGADYWTPRPSPASPYTNVGPAYPVDNIPPSGNIVRLTAGGTHTLSFSDEISNIYLAFVSLNNNAWVFTTEAILLSVSGMNIDGNGQDSSGFFGSGNGTSITPTLSNEWILRGPGEPHGTLVLPGDFTSLSWTGSSEGWHGFTIGVAGVSTPQIPVPASLPLITGALLLLGFLRRRS